MTYFTNFIASRAESSPLEERVEAQAKELSQRKLRLEELKEKERVANENVEGLMMDITAAEEEITRWKVAAEQEATAGGAVEHDFTSQECKDLGFDTIELNAGSFGVPEDTLLRFFRLIKSAGLRAKPQFGVKFNKADIPVA